MYYCLCGSGKIAYPVYDARNIFAFYACEMCEKQKKEEFKKEVFTDPNYWISEEEEDDNDK